MSNSISVGLSPGIHVARPWWFNALLTFAEGDGWVLNRIKGTHRTMTKPGHPSMTVVVEHRLVRPVYVRQVLAVVRRCRSGRCPFRPCRPEDGASGAGAAVTTSGPKNGNGGRGHMTAKVAGEPYAFAGTKR